jgi:alginate O-acetyltransferase complex protein AlgJ
VALRTTSIERLTIALFIAMICAPLVGTVVGVRKDAALARFEEHRDPEWSLRPRKLMRSLQDVRTNYNQSFTFRDQLIWLHAFIKLDVFNVSSAPNVTLGRDGWLFYAGEHVVADYQRTRPFTQDELERWRQLLVHRKDWLARRGIPFVFTVAPNPQTIYPEQMPSNMWRAANPSRMDQLFNYLRTTSDVDVLDLRPALLAAKPTTQVVYKTDTHWNQLGGFIAYREIATWLKSKFAALRTFTLERDFARRDVADWHGGLSYFLGRPSGFAENRVELVPRERGFVLSDGLPLGDDEILDAWYRRARVERTSLDGEIDCALVLRDSQFAAPGHFLSRHFKRMVLVWTPKLDPALVEKERPNVVIFEMAERLLMNPVPEDPPLP